MRPYFCGLTCKSSPSDLLRDPMAALLATGMDGSGQARSYLGALAVAGALADFAPVGQAVFCHGWQLRVKNALSLGWIITT
jgi:energy-converting hydrogenase Eha subunit C